MDGVWSVAMVLAAALFGAGAAAWWLRRGSAPPPLPREWHLTLRPVFTSQERHLYRQLTQLFPQHAILAKLPLTRFTQPSEPARVQYWHDLIAGLHVTFAVCSPGGRVLAALDVEGPRGGSRRASAIKTAVLRTCRVRYLCFMVDDLPSLDEVRHLVLEDGPWPAGSAATAPSPLDEARSTLASTVRKRREQRDAQWQDSTFSHDSFFAPDSRLDSLADSGFSTLPSPAPPQVPRPPRPSDIVGRVVDRPAASPR